MKRLLPLILALACMLSLCACGGEPGGQAYFNATVLAVNEGSAELECTDKLTSGISVGERFTISTDTASSGARRSWPSATLSAWCSTASSWRATPYSLEPSSPYTASTRTAGSWQTNESCAPN